MGVGERVRAAGVVAGLAALLGVIAGCGAAGSPEAAAPPAAASLPSVSPAAAYATAAPTGYPAATGDPVVDWNVIALRTTAAAPVDPPREARTLAIVQSAVFDALIALDGGVPGPVGPTAVAGADADAAAVAATARDVLGALYPDQRAALDARYDEAVSALTDAAREAGVAAGRRAAADLLAHRAHDRSDAAAADPTPAADPGAGRWRPTPPALAAALEPGWGRVTPFVLRRPEQFRPPPPYTLTDADYTRDFAELVKAGGADSAVRTPDQTQAAQFWRVTATQQWNQLAQNLIGSEHLSRLEAARLLAQLNLAEADAAIAAWDAKFTYRQWRPVSGIREAADDGNPATAAVPDWTPLVPTPPFPDYVCGHTTLAGAAQAVLEKWFGTGAREVELTSAALPGVVRHYASFAAVGDEVLQARVWGGVHWRTSCERGRALGRSVGRYVLEHSAAPARSR